MSCHYDHELQVQVHHYNNKTDDCKICLLLLYLYVGTRVCVSISRPFIVLRRLIFMFILPAIVLFLFFFFFFLYLWPFTPAPPVS